MRSIINEKNLNNKKILLRLDLNVPLERNKITDTTRIDKILPTLNFLIKEKAKIIILSHVGRPKGKIVKELSLKPICEELQNKLKKKVKLITKNIKDIKSKNFFSLPTESFKENLKHFNIIHPKYTQGIFDAASIGQYCFGIDPKISKYYPTKNLFINENSKIDFKNFEIFVNDYQVWIKTCLLYTSDACRR